MADTRINALSTATSSVSDDFVPIDGTTNGTRKLSAYSPTFGGNATVGGTLTVSGGISVGTGTGLQTTGWLAYQSDTRFLIRDQVNSQVAMDFIAGAAPYARATNSFLVLGTTASTSTSSGALVVGNGTSGGLGVGGAIYAGGSLTLAGTASSIATSSADSMARIGFGLFTKDQAVTIGLSRRANYGDALIARNLQGQSGTDAYITSETTAAGGYGGFEIQHAGVARILVGSGATTANAVVTPTVAASFTTTTAAVSTVLQVTNTTASTGTSSGALVVSGGVGVAGNVCMGGDLSIQADKGIYQKQGNVHKWTSDGASTGTARADIYADSSGVLFFRTNGATEALSLNASQTAQFAGAVVANAASGAFRITNSQTPASAAATGTAGTIAWDSSYIYVCTATNTWKRVAISTW